MDRKGKAATSQFFRKTAVVQRVNRKHWNKAVDLIDNYKRPPSRQNSCFRSGPSSRHHPRYNNTLTTVPFFLIELRQAILRHDWSAIHRLFDCLLDMFENYRVVCCKVMMMLLCSSSSSDIEIFQDFCRMALGLSYNEEMTVFLKTICSLPKEIPRGYLRGVLDKLYVKKESGLAIADAFLQASRDHRQEDE